MNDISIYKNLNVKQTYQKLVDKMGSYVEYVQVEKKIQILFSRKNYII